MRQAVDAGSPNSDNRRSGQPRPSDSTRLDVPASRGPLDRAHARRLGDGLRRHRADAAGARRPRPQPTAPGAALPPAPRVRAVRPGPPGVGRRPALQPLLPHPPHRAAEACRRRRAQAARRAPVLPAPGPLQAAVGDLARAEHVRRALRADRQDPPRARRRHLRRRHHDGPVRHRARAGARRRRPRPWSAKPLPGPAKLLGEALLERSTVPAEMARGARALLRAPAQGRHPASRTASPASARRRSPGINAPAPPSPFNVDIGPHRRYTFVDADLATVQGDQGLARRHAQRRRARRRQPRPRALPAQPRPRHRGPRAEGDGAGVGAHQGAARRARQPGRRDVGAAAGRRREPRGVPAQDRRRDGGPEEVRPGGRRAGADQPRRLRAAHDPQPGRAPAGTPAVLQPRRHERARAAVPAVPARAAPARCSTRSCRSPSARRSGSRS